MHIKDRRRGPYKIVLKGKILLKNADRSELRSQCIGRVKRFAASESLIRDQLDRLAQLDLLGISHLYVCILPYKDIYLTTSFVYGV